MGPVGRQARRGSWGFGRRPRPDDSDAGRLLLGPQCRGTKVLDQALPGYADRSRDRSPQDAPRVAPGGGPEREGWEQEPIRTGLCRAGAWPPAGPARAGRSRPEWDPGDPAPRRTRRRPPRSPAAEAASGRGQVGAGRCAAVRGGAGRRGRGPTRGLGLGPLAVPGVVAGLRKPGCGLRAAVRAGVGAAPPSRHLRGRQGGAGVRPRGRWACGVPRVARRGCGGAGLRVSSPLSSGAQGRPGDERGSAPSAGGSAGLWPG